MILFPLRTQRMTVSTLAIIGHGTSRSFRTRRCKRGKTSFARDGSRQANTVSNDVNDSSTLSSVSRALADDFAFRELSVFQLDDMG